MSSVTVNRLGDEPIIIAKFTGHVTIEMVDEAYQKSAEILDQEPSQIRFVRISDYTEANTEFRDLIKLVASASSNKPGSASDPRLIPILVGTDAMVRLGADFTKGRTAGKTEMMLFKEMDDAIEAARIQIKRQTHA